MANRVTVRVGGAPYSLIADESPEYVEKLASHLNEAFPAGGMPAATGAVLAGLAVTDELFRTREKNRETDEQLRTYEAETLRLRGEVAALKRELSHLRTQLNEREGADQ